ncbi:hypothetical protein 8P_046 [Pseudomonas phage 8P]|nr:hypothetical protein 8P_046 [Pseudomonas phage 8P]
MRKQATRNADLIAAQKKRQARRELLIAIPVLIAFAFTFAYAIVGFLTPLPH